ncbi:MAG TPA: hydrogenase maturation protease [Streptosporangiaceae bacterium]|nr:hydrogenase maturation protease [Streptosporangiaceae bacterium]
MRVLVAGIGNIFLGDDGFGSEVIKRLPGLPGSVQAADYGISGMHLAYDLAEGYDTVILIDAAPRGDQPGTVTVVEVSQVDPQPAAGLLDAHGMQPDVVLGLLGSRQGRMLVVGCEPATVDYGMGLSEPVAAAVDEAVRIVLDLVKEAVHVPGHTR